MHNNCTEHRCQAPQWEWSRPLCSEPQVGRLKVPKPMVTQKSDWVLSWWPATLQDSPLYLGTMAHPHTPGIKHRHVHEISVNETRQIKATMPKDNSFFSREKKKVLPQEGFEPATFCVLGRHSTSWATEAAQLGKPNLRLCNAKGVSLLINRATLTQYCGVYMNTTSLFSYHKSPTLRILENKLKLEAICLKVFWLQNYHNFIHWYARIY